MKYLFWPGAAALALLLVSGCTGSEEDVRPTLDVAETRQAVLGKWSIEKINNRLCRSGICNNSVSNGAAQDYFEFRPDSAFLFRAGISGSNYVYRDRFKAEYTHAGGMVLSNFGWSAKFEVKKRETNKLVLEGTFTGTDPNAVFTDTYYLYR